MTKQYTPQEVLAVMRKISLMTLAVSDYHSQPQSHMMTFAVDDDFCMYFVTTPNSSKHSALQQNNKVGISVWSDKKMLVQIQAEVLELKNTSAKKAIDKVATAAADLSDHWSPLLQITNGNYVAFKVFPKSIRVLDLSSSTMSSTQTVFTNIGALI